MSEKLRSWVSEHKVASIVLAVVIVFVGFSVLSLGMILLGGSPMSSQMQRGGDAGSSPYETSADAAGSSSLSLFGNTRTESSSPRDSSSGSFVEVQEARFDIESTDAAGDTNHISSIAAAHDGYVEESRKHESSLYRTFYLTVRVPDERFDSFTDSIQSQYDVDSFNVKNYRLPTQREVDELTILNRTLADYEDMREQIRDMNNSEEKIHLLMELTDKELDVKERQKRYEQDLSDKQKRGDEATIRIELRERKSVEVWPENLKNRFMSNIKDMLNALTDIGLGTATQAVVLFFKAIQAIIYLVVIALPFLLAYRIGRYVYEEHWK